jgi:hypothetical protein
MTLTELSGLKRFDQKMLGWALAYPSLGRDRRALNVLFGVVEVLLLGRLGFDLATAQMDMVLAWMLALAAVVGCQAAFNAIAGLAGMVKTLALHRDGSPSPRG